MGLRSTGNDATALAAGLFAQEQLAVGDFVLRGGLRYGYNEQSYALLGGASPGVPDKSWSRLLWSAGVRWNASPELALFTNAGSSFVAPDAEGRRWHAAGERPGVAGATASCRTRSSRPRAASAATWRDWRLPRGLRLGVRAFLNRIDDVIVDNVVSQNPSQTRSV